MTSLWNKPPKKSIENTSPTILRQKVTIMYMGGVLFNRYYIPSFNIT